MTFIVSVQFRDDVENEIEHEYDTLAEAHSFASHLYYTSQLDYPPSITDEDGDESDCCPSCFNRTTAINADGTCDDCEFK